MIKMLDWKAKVTVEEFRCGGLWGGNRFFASVREEFDPGGRRTQGMQENVSPTWYRFGTPGRPWHPLPY